MLNKHLKQCLSLVLALVMVFSMLPVSTFAEEIEPTEASPEETQAVMDPTETSQTEAPSDPTAESEEPYNPTEDTTAPSAEPEESSAPSVEVADPTEEPKTEVNPMIAKFQKEMDRILETYLGDADIPAEEVPDKAALLDEAALSNSAFEILVLAEDMQFALDDGLITEAEGEELVEANPAALAFSDYAMDYALDMPMYASSGTWTPVDGLEVAVSGATSTDYTNDIVTVTAQGSGGLFGIGASAKTAKITLTNKYDVTAKITCAVTKTSVNSFTASGGTLSDTNFSVTLDAGSSVTLTLQTAKNSTTNKVLLSGFSCVREGATSTLTMQYDSNLGSVTAGGTAIANNGTATVGSDGISLVATPASGVTFVGWVNASDNKVISQKATYTMPVANDMTVKAVFSSDAMFTVNGILYETLGAAATAAQNGSVKTVVLAANGTLPAGEYTIPSGVTLLIPFDDANTLYTTTPGYIESWSQPGFYRTLTMAEGAHITVNGAVSLSAKHSAQFGYNGMPTGNVSRIIMSSGSSITVNNSATLYAWGYITGSGTVTAKSGSTIYENFQLKDWRGGSQTTSMQNGVFPMSQYYFQNIEVPLTIESGAIERGVTTASLSIVGNQTVPLDLFASSGALFNITSGSVTKDYLEGSDQLSFEINGSLTISEYTLKLSVYKINTADYVFPIPGHFKMCVKSGNISLNQDISFYPGSEFMIESGATMTVGSGHEIYIYDADQWGTYCYYNSGNVKMVPLNYAPGRTCAIRTADSLKDAEFCVNGTLSGNIYTSSSGAKVYSTETGTISQSASANTAIHQIIMNISGDTDQYDEITFVPAILKNKDGSDPASITSTSNTYNYNAVHGKWVAGEHTNNAPVQENVQDATCGEAGSYDSVVYCACGYKVSTTSVEVPATGNHTDADSNAICDICGEPLCAHTNTELQGKVDATCSSSGYTGDTVCKDCGNTVETGSEISAAGHNEKTTEKVTQDATCYQDGSKTVTVTCNTCGEKVSEKEVAIPATGDHTYSETLSYNDSQHYYACTTSGCSATSSAKNHSWDNACDTECNDGCGYTRSVTHDFTGDWVTNETTHARKCKVCGTTNTAAAHAAGEAKQENLVDSTCYSEGSYNEVVYCSECNYKLNSTAKTIAKKDHTPAAAVRENEVAATCTAAGSYDEVVYCTKCNTELSRETKTIDKLSHTEAIREENRVEATCGKAGSYDLVTYCTECMVVINTEKKTIQASGSHNWNEGEITTPATCTKAGEMLYTCIVCQSTKTEAIAINADAHSWNEGEITTVATCKTEGVKTFTCQHNGEHTKTENIGIDKDNHAELKQVEAKAPTCVDVGWEAYEYCTECDYTTYVEKEALGHTPSEPVRVDKEGNKYDLVIKCTVCGTETGRTSYTSEIVTETFEKVPEAIQEAYETVEELESKMEESAKAYFEAAFEGLNPEKAETVLYDVVMKYTDADGEEHVADEDHFPENGELTIRLPIPAGTNLDNYTFFVAHMFTSDAFGKEIGSIEHPEVTEIDEGNGYIQFVVTGLSPVTVTYLCTDHSYNDGEVTTAPTCTKPGVKTFTCTVCRHSYTEIIEATGQHTGGTATCKKPAICDVCKQSYGDKDPENHASVSTETEWKRNETNHWQSCPDCETEVNKDEHSYVDGKCECGAEEPAIVEAKLEAIGISYDAEVQLQLRFTLPEELVGDDNAYAEYILDGKTSTISMSEIRDFGTNNKGYYTVVIGIPSGLMTYDTTVRFYTGDGNVVTLTDYMYPDFIGTEVVRSVIDYARLALERGTNEQKAIVSALLVYGGYAQPYFDKDVTNPAYNLLTEFGREIPALEDINADTITQELTYSSASNGVSYFNQTAYLDSALYLRTRFALTEGESIDNYTFILTYEENHVSKTMELEVNADERYPGKYYVDILNIPAAYWDYMYKITVTNNTTGETYEVNCSVMAWVDRLLGASKDEEQIMMGKAMYYYNQAANTFFGK